MQQVLVVGAGPTGLVAAALLRRYGIEARVIDKRPEPYDLPRAVHLDDECMRVLQQLGVELETRTALGLRLLDREHRVMAEFPGGRAGSAGRRPTCSTSPTWSARCAGWWTSSTRS